MTDTPHNLHGSLGGAPRGNRNAAKPPAARKLATLQVKCTADEKALWVKAGAGRLSQWVRGVLNEGARRLGQNKEQFNATQFDSDLAESDE